MDFSTIKQQARAVIKGRKKTILTASLLFFLLVLLFSYLSYRLTMPPREQLLSLTDRVTAYVLSGDYDAASRLIASVQPSIGETVASDLLSYVQAIVSFGFLLLLFNAVRGKELELGMLLDGFSTWAKVLLVELISRLIITLCFWALIVPGFFALYSYRMARYLLLTHPEFGVIDCLRESRLRMRGHRMELFRLDLSFLGWGLLSAIPVLGLIPSVWALPYWKCSTLLACESINAAYESVPRPQQDNDRFIF